MTDEVTRLPVRYRDPQTETVLNAVDRPKCFHKRFDVDAAKEFVECRDCGERLNPMWVLQQLTIQESHWCRLHDRYQDEMARLSKRSRTRCARCGEMTPISHR